MDGVEIADEVGCGGSEGKIKFRTMRARIGNLYDHRELVGVQLENLVQLPPSRSQNDTRPWP